MSGKTPKMVLEEPPMATPQSTMSTPTPAKPESEKKKKKKESNVSLSDPLTTTLAIQKEKKREKAPLDKSIALVYLNSNKKEGIRKIDSKGESDVTSQVYVILQD